MSEKILFVDDEPALLDALRRLLRGRFEVEVAEGGDAGLAALAARGPFAVVVSDLRMPEMNGIEFLGRTRELAPDTVRIMLTGHADLGAATSAVNEGNIYRFLTKPCPHESLVRALEDGLRQHRLIVAERQLLEQTLAGAVQVLTEVLSLVNPVAFGRAARIKPLVTHLARGLGLPDLWQYELAAMLSQIGCVALPAETLEKSFAGQPLAADEAESIRRHPRFGAGLLARIPRLERVATMVALQSEKGDESRPDDVHLGGEMLRLAIDFDDLIIRGEAPAAALTKIRAVSRPFPNRLLEALAGFELHRAEEVIRSVSLRELGLNMILDEEIRSASGVLLAPPGHRVTAVLLERLRVFARGVGLVEPFRVRVPREAEEPTGCPSPQTANLQAVGSSADDRGRHPGGVR